MSYKVKDICHETRNYFVIKVSTGYEIYKNGITHATRCAQIGYKNQEGLSRAIAECERREAQNVAK